MTRIRCPECRGALEEGGICGNGECDIIQAFYDAEGTLHYEKWVQFRMSEVTTFWAQLQEGWLFCSWKEVAGPSYWEVLP